MIRLIFLMVLWPLPPPTEGSRQSEDSFLNCRAGRRRVAKNLAKSETGGEVREEKGDGSASNWTLRLSIVFNRVKKLLILVLYVCLALFFLGFCCFFLLNEAYLQHLHSFSCCKCH